MTCEQIERDEIAEQYLAGRLSSADRFRFEAHYFDCAHCHNRLRMLEDIRTEIARDRAAMPGRSVSPPAAVRPGRRVWRLAGAGLAAAALVMLAVRISQNSDHDFPAGPPVGSPGRGDVTLSTPPSAPPARNVDSLAQIQPPRYEPLRLRANTTRAQREFRDAMERYVAGDYGAAAVGLRRVIALDGSLVGASFYLAICVLQRDQIDEGVTSLQRVIAFGESPYLEDAHFFLAKVRIRQGQIAAARSELAQVMALDGDRRDEARQLLAQLP